MEVDWVKEEEQENETRAEKVQRLVKTISSKIKKVHTKSTSNDDGEAWAALALEAQIELTEFLADAELISKEKKLLVEALEGQKYLTYKKEKDKDEKPTEALLKAKVAQDKEVNDLKKEQFKAESDFSKWKNLFAVLKDAHILFRNLNKG